MRRRKTRRCGNEEEKGFIANEAKRLLQRRAWPPSCKKPRYTGRRVTSFVTANRIGTSSEPKASIIDLRVRFFV